MIQYNMFVYTTAKQLDRHITAIFEPLLRVSDKPLGDDKERFNIQTGTSTQ